MTPTLAERARALLRRAGQLRPERCVALAALLPLPLWFGWAVLWDPGPAWRVVYFQNPDFSGAQLAQKERRASRYWDRELPSVPGDFDVHQFSARWDTCVSLREAAAIPFQLVVNGSARFSIDEQERLRAGKGKERDAHGEVLQLDAGVHHLSVDFSSAGWPSIALNASLDGRAPVAVPPPARTPGVKWFQPQPGAEPCSR